MVRFSTHRDNFRIIDSDKRLHVPRHGVRATDKLASKVGQLHRFVLERAIGKQQNRSAWRIFHSINSFWPVNVMIGLLGMPTRSALFNSIRDCVAIVTGNPRRRAMPATALGWLREPLPQRHTALICRNAGDTAAT
jgi:hypothetical protein